MREAQPTTDSTVLGSQRRRFALYFILSLTTALLYGLAYTLSVLGAVKHPYPEWWMYPTIMLGSLLLPAAYGLLFALLARWRVKRSPEIRHGFFWVAAMLGLVVVPGYFYLSRGLSRIDCGDTCVGVPSDIAWVAMAAVSLTLAVAVPLLFAYYRWPRETRPTVSYVKRDADAENGR